MTSASSAIAFSLPFCRIEALGIGSGQWQMGGQPAPKFAADNAYGVPLWHPVPEGVQRACNT
jgi:hypothetical protein